MESLIKEEKFQNVAAYQANYDTDKAFRREFSVRWQTTLIVFKGKKEVGRSLADLDKGSIRSLFTKGL